MKTIAFYLSVLVSFISLLTSCQKSDESFLNDNFKNVKVYNDTLASVNNLDTKIAAGNGCIYMTYGRGGFEATPIGNISVIGYSNIYSINLMATDNEGKLLWTIPVPKTDISMGGLVAINDGCLLVAKSNSFWFSQYIYFIFFDRAGQLVSTDSALFPSSITNTAFPFLNDFNITKSTNGNIIVYGNYSDMGNLAFACEYTLNGTLQWAKSHYHFPMLPDFGNQQAYFSGCTPTSDGGYLFLGTANSDSWAIPLKHRITLFKLSASGDSLWSKSFIHDNINWNSTGNIIPAANGNYYFYFISGDTRSVMNIYEINSDGDSLNSVSVDILEQNNGTVILPKNDGGVFALMNIYGPMINSGQGDAVFIQTNTTHLSLSSDLTVTAKEKFQSETSDFITTASKTSDDRIACFGMIQGFGKNYYKPALILIN